MTASTTEAKGCPSEELRALIKSATDDYLADGGRYFGDSCQDLTHCTHGDMGRYDDPDDGVLIEWLWNRRAEIADLYDARRTPDPAGAVEGGQDRKFAFRNGQFVNRVSGEAIPADEPIIIFRARDRHAEAILREYLTLATDEHHRAAIRDRMTEFAAYRAAHPKRMKEPGITHHIALNSDDATPTTPRVEPMDQADAREVRSLIARLLGHADYDEDMSDALRRSLRDAAASFASMRGGEVERLREAAQDVLSRWEALTPGDKYAKAALRQALADLRADAATDATQRGAEAVREAMQEAAHVLGRVPISAMVGKCGWKNWEQAANGIAAILEALALPSSDTPAAAGVGS